MGRGVIIEHLGDAQYRVGLDIDLTYARRQLADIEAYLEAFAETYAAAGARVDAAKAALAPINDRLTAYLTAAQQACQAAYDAERAAYDEWVDAINNQPDPEALAFLQSVRDAANTAFLAAPTLETLLAVSAADGAWQTACGDALDPAAVALATDAKDAAQADVLSAAEALADEQITQAQYDAYVDAYETARGVWITAISDNTVASYVNAKKAAFDAAKAAFDAARKALGKLLNNGGVPEELAAIMADQEKAWAEYRAALQDYAALTLTKTEKETQAAYLRSRLLPYTDEEGEPIREPVNAWCCDFTEDLEEGATVATIEIPGERDLAIRVRPGYESRETWTAARDGLLTPSFASSPEATYFNWALHPGNARWNPNYRLGEILLIDRLAGTCTVQLDQQTNNSKSRAPNGTVLDVVNPIKYEIDPDTGEQIIILPGPDVHVAAGITTLANVAIEYMDCNSDIFEVGDRVMVEFQDRQWTTPKVIGFAENPRACSKRAIVFEGLGPGGLERLVLNDDPPPALQHGGVNAVGGNLDWVSTDGKTCLTWEGPRGRAFAPHIYGGNAVSFRYVTDYYSAPDDVINSVRSIGGHIAVLTTRFDVYLWRNGKLIAVAPPGLLFMGAGQIDYIETPIDGPSIRHRYIVGAFCLPREGYPDAFNNIPLADYPEFMRHIVAFARLEDSGQIDSGDWTTIHTAELSDYEDVLPPVGAYFFSASGLKFAALVPTTQTNITSTPDATFTRTNIGNDLIIRGSLIASPAGVSLAAFDLEWQDNNEGTETYSATGSGGDGLEYYGAWSSSLSRGMQQSGSAVVAIDFIGETEVTASGVISRAFSQVGSAGGFSTEAAPEADYGSGGRATSEQVSWTLTDDYRSITIGMMSYEASSSFDEAFAFEGLGFNVSESSNEEETGSSQTPLFYDLRYGAAVYELGQGDHSISFSRNGVFGLDSQAGTFSRDETMSVELLISTNGADPPSLPVVDAKSRSTSGPTTTPAPDYGSPHYPTSEEWSIAAPGESVCNKARPFGWLKNSNHYLYVTLCVPDSYTQRADTSGGLVHRVDDRRYVSLGEYLSFYNAFADLGQTYTDQPVHALLSQPFSIETLWQAHLAAVHPPAEEEDPYTVDGISAGLKPLFRQ